MSMKHAKQAAAMREPEIDRATLQTFFSAGLISHRELCERCPTCPQCADRPRLIKGRR